MYGVTALFLRHYTLKQAVIREGDVKPAQAPEPGVVPLADEAQIPRESEGDQKEHPEEEDEKQVTDQATPSGSAQEQV